MNNVGTNKKDITSYLYSYLKEDVLYAQLLFVNGYISAFFDKHIQCHTQIYPKSNRAGFRSVDMGVNLYLIHHNLEDLKESWRTQTFMALFVHTYPATIEYKIDGIVSDFFKIVKHRMKKTGNKVEKAALIIFFRRRCTPCHIYFQLVTWYIGTIMDA